MALGLAESSSLPRFLLAIAAFLYGLAASGCAHNPSLMVYLDHPDGKRRLEPRILVDDRRISKHVGIEAIDNRYLDGFLRARVKLRNAAWSDYSIMYRFIWEDAGGFPIKSPAGIWHSALIEGKETLTLDGDSPSTRASNFRLEISKHKNPIFDRWDR